MKRHGLSIGEYSRHAEKRAAERFPGVNLDAEFECSELMTGKHLKRAKKQCPKTSGNVTKKSHVSYFLSRSGIIFVYDWMAKRLITVFPYGSKET